jgi:hypothetical protein
VAPRYFSIREANELVPFLQATFGRVIQVRSQLRSAYQELEKLGSPPTKESLDDLTGPAPLVRARAKFRALYETLQTDLKEVDEVGVQVKDIDTGLCDFLALRDGREVLLCWRFGEREVGHWHDLETGFAGRQPITDEDRAKEQTLH